MMCLCCRAVDFGWVLGLGVWFDCAYGFGLPFVLSLLISCLFSSVALQFALFGVFWWFDCVCVLVVLSGEFVV